MGARFRISPTKIRLKVSQIGVHSDNDSGTTYSADISYDYQLEGISYTSSKIKIGNVSTSDSSDARRKLNEYPFGKKVSVYYNPEDPYVAVLEPGIHGSAFFLPIFGLCFAGFGILFIFLVLKGEKETQRRLNERYPQALVAKGKTIEELLRKRSNS